MTHVVRRAGSLLTYDGRIVVDLPDQLIAAGLAGHGELVPARGALVDGDDTISVAGWARAEQGRIGKVSAESAEIGERIVEAVVAEQAEQAHRLVVCSGEWFDAFAHLTRLVMTARGYLPQACVAGTWIGREVLRAFGVAAEPLPVRVIALTADAAAWHTEHGWADPTPVGHAVGIGHAGAGGAVRGVGPDGRGGTWDGHLVLRVPVQDRVPGGLLVDITIEQAHRPDRGLWVQGPAVVPLEWPWPDGMSQVYAQGDTVLVYSPMAAGANNYREAPDWRRDSALRSRTVGAVVRALRAGSAS